MSSATTRHSPLCIAPRSYSIVRLESGTGSGDVDSNSREWWMHVITTDHSACCPVCPLTLSGVIGVGRSFISILILPCRCRVDALFGRQYLCRLPRWWTTRLACLPFAISFTSVPDVRLSHIVARRIWFVIHSDRTFCIPHVLFLSSARLYGVSFVWNIYSNILRRWLRRFLFCAGRRREFRRIRRVRQRSSAPLSRPYIWRYELRSRLWNTPIECLW